jgi:type IV pilus assembly protein PilC
MSNENSSQRNKVEGTAPSAAPTSPILATAKVAAMPSAALPRKRLKLGFFDSLSTQDKIDFARHLSIVIKAGLPIYKGLDIIRSQTSSKVLKKIIEQVQVDVNNGRFLADALAQYQDQFGDFFVNIIRVGESSGTLAQNLLYLADELRKSKALSSKVKSAMVYPLVILTATIGVTGFLTFFVFPKLLPVLQGMKVKLPASTVALISTVNFLQKYGVITAIVTMVFIFLIRMLVKKVTAVRYMVHMMILYIPAVGALSTTINMTNFTRVLGLLLKSGVKIVTALDITANTFDNLVYRRAIQEANEEVRKGSQLASYLSTRKHLFSALLTGMIMVGETTGNLEENLAYLSTYFEDEVDEKLRGMTSLLEPLMLLLMGALVGFVAISIITPIYSMSSGVK